MQLEEKRKKKEKKKKRVVWDLSLENVDIRLLVLLGNLDPD